MPQYQGIWTLPQQSQAQANQQWVTDPKFKDTVLLLQADGMGNGSQNNTFLDGSTNNFPIIRYSNTTQGSFSPFSETEGSWSNYFSGGYLRTTSSTALGLSTNPFTIEAWVYMTDRAAQYWVVGGQASTQVYIHTDGTLIFSIPGVRSLAASSGTVPLNTWTHVAYVRSSTGTNGFAYYINGVQSGRDTLADDLGTASAGVEVGRTNNGAGVTAFTGYMSNVRVVKGTAVYLNSFTPPTTPLTAIANTSLLTCQSNQFIDNSTSNATFSSSSIYVQTFSPFAPARQWTPEVVGGSAHFDGSDYLTLAPGAAFAFGTGDFTVETWFYPTSAPTDDYIIEARNSGQTDTWSLNFGYGGTNGQLNWGYNGTTLIAATTNDTVKPYVWSHIAYTRTGTTGSLYVNGVRVGTGTDSSNYSVSPTTSYIGCRFSTENFADGYFSGMRVVKGTALYTGTSYTIPTAPPTAITNTQLLLNYTNAGVYDATMNTEWHMSKVSGGTLNNVQVSNLPAKNGNGSIYFDGTAYQNLLPAQNYPQLTFGTQDFTLECWIYVIGKNASSASAIYDQRPGVNGTYPSWWLDFGGYSVGSVGAPRLIFYADSAVFMSGGVVPMGVWTHIAFCRANGYSRMFINGSLTVGPTADAKNYISGGSAGNFRPSIGSADGGDSLNGYIDDFRVSRFARYVANFTPPQQALPRQ